MSKQHKWHKEIKAWADGAEIECKNSIGIWVDVPNPDWNAKGWEYRIKPQPKEPTYLYVYNFETECKTIIRYNEVKDWSYALVGKITLIMEVDDES